MISGALRTLMITDCPTRFLSRAHVWHWYVVPPSMSSVEGETCSGDVDDTISYVDEPGTEIEKESAFTSLEVVPELPAFATLPCYVVKKNGLTLIRWLFGEKSPHTH